MFVVVVTVVTAVVVEVMLVVVGATQWLQLLSFKVERVVSREQIST